MGGWSDNAGGWHRVRRGRPAGVAGGSGWTALDVVVAVAALAIRWEAAFAFVGLKLWQQASGHRGSVFAFAREKWDALVAFTRSVLGGVSLPSLGGSGLPFAARSSGNVAFDRWRRTELARIEAERDRLRLAERDFASYRDELLHAKDREDFERFMQARERDLEDRGSDGKLRRPDPRA